jgi:hypothetical protein
VSPDIVARVDLGSDAGHVVDANVHRGRVS